MRGKIYLFAGIVLIVVGVIVSRSNPRVRVNHRVVSAEESRDYLNYIVVGLGGLGLFFAILGLTGIIRGSKQNKKNQIIMQNGIDAQGTVTFVDKNWNALVNNIPIYSIVEYTYQDKTNNKYTRRINTLNSEFVIRKQIQVGSNIPIKYLAENPAESLLVL